MSEAPEPLSLAALKAAKAIRRERFVSVGGVPSKRYMVDVREVLAAAGLASSIAEADALIHRGELEIDGRTFNPGPVDSPETELKLGSVLRIVGQRVVKLVD